MNTVIALPSCVSQSVSRCSTTERHLLPHFVILRSLCDSFPSSLYGCWAGSAFIILYQLFELLMKKTGKWNQQTAPSTVFSYAEGGSGRLWQLCDVTPTRVRDAKNKLVDISFGFLRDLWTFSMIDRISHCKAPWATELIEESRSGRSNI